MAAVDPDLPIIDPHHHLYPHNHWGRAGGPYLLPEFAKDLTCSHNIVSTVYVEASQLYRETGPDRLKPAGEVEFAAVVGRMAETGHFGKARICEGIVGAADLTLGAGVDEVLRALESAADGRLRGVRCPTAWDPDPLIGYSKRGFARQNVMGEADFREGLRRVAANGLIYEAWQFYPQLAELSALANAVPEATIVAGHCGGLLGNRAYANADNFAHWRQRILELSRCPNVVMKLGGLAADRTGFGFQARQTRPDAKELIETWRPYIDTCIAAFGPNRCMFESNFPVDACAADYETLWTVFKAIAAPYSAEQQADLFAGVARRTYRLR